MGRFSRFTYLRGVNILMSLLTTIFVFLFTLYLYLLPSWGPPVSELILAAPPFVLTFGLVWYYLSSNPDPKILPYIHVVPVARKEGKERAIIDKNHQVKLVSGVGGSKNFNLPAPVKDGGRLTKVKHLRFSDFPDKLEVRFDIGNKGRSGITLHEYWVEGEGGRRQVCALHDNRSIRIPPPLVNLTELIYEEAYKKVNSLLPSPVLELNEPDGREVWALMNLDDTPKKFIHQETNERVFLKAKARIPESFDVPLGVDRGEKQLKKGKMYNYKVKIYTTSSTPTDSVTISIVAEDDVVKWWVTRSECERKLRRALR